MMNSYVLLSALLCLLINGGRASPVNNQDLLQITSADLAVNAQIEQLMKSERRLIKTSPNLPAKWMTHNEIRLLRVKGQHFMDVTYTGDREVAVKRKREGSGISPKITQQVVAKKLVAKADDSLMKSALKTLTGFKNRYYQSSFGAKSSNWIFQKVKEIISSNKVEGMKITTRQVTHAWSQKSIIVHIDGSDRPNEVVIVGGHQDSINMFNEVSGTAPGADDDGTGTVCLLEALRATLAAKYIPKRSLEFHWYAGEEGGLLGSQDIAKDYQQKGVMVIAMFQLDMTGFPKQGQPDVGMVTDYTDRDLVDLVSNLVPEYTGLQANTMECGYGCSDHASWNEFGFPSVFPFESSNLSENDNIHSEHDLYDTVDFEHALKFVKLALAFVAEVTGRINLS